jgi:RHS repeat-associated protein
VLWVHNSLGLPDLISYTEIVRFVVFAQSIAFRLAPILSVWVWLWLIVVPTQAAFFRDWASVSEYDGAEKTTGGGLEMRRSHAWGLDVTGTPQGSGGVGDLLFTAHHESGIGTGVHTVCYDGNGNVTALANPATSTLTAYYDYDAFGSTLRATGPAALANSYRFSTKPVDEETGLVYYGYRWYHPELGRWLSRDPIGEAGGLNLYGMVGNDPVNGVDVLGLEVSLGDYWQAFWDHSWTGPATERGVENVINAGEGIFVPIFEGFGKWWDDPSTQAEMFADGLETLWKQWDDILFNDPCFWKRFREAYRGGWEAIQNDPDLQSQLAAQVGVEAFMAAVMARAIPLRPTAANTAGRANTLVHNGMEVRAVRDLSHVDNSTLGAMAEKGFAPRTINGDKIVVHHHQQNPAGFIVEMPAKNHNIWNTNQHPFGNAPGVGLSAEQRARFRYLAGRLLEDQSTN